MTITVSDSRAEAILQWLATELQLPISDFQPASSDASFRRYFRVTSGEQSYIVMDAPPDKEDIAPFIQVAELLQSAQVNVPEILHKNSAQGFLLLEDFGRQCLLDVLTDSNVDHLYGDALASLLSLQRNIDPKHSALPAYDQTLLHKELCLFSDWFVEKLCQLDMSEHIEKCLQDSYQILIASALQQKQVCVHRDYHSRNLMYLADDNPGIIDFQDAVIGPISYDLVSLLRDCYISWPEAQIERYLRDYYQQLQQAQLIDCDYAQFQRDFDLMGIQRHLKAIGIFSRLKFRDGKHGYVADIPRTLDYVIRISGRYPELHDLHAFILAYIKPLGHKFV